MANANKLDAYATSYFTGTQASIWIGDTWVDEVFGIQFSASQSIIPIFGYASSFYDAVARGKVLVHGQFEINFIDEGYLYSIINRLAGQKMGGGYDSTDVLEKLQREGKYEVNEYSTVTTDRIKRTQADVIKEQIQLLRESADGAYPDARSRRQTMSQILTEVSQLDLVSIEDLGSELDREQRPGNLKNRNIIYNMHPFTLKGYFGNPDLTNEGTGAMKEIEDCFLIGNEMIVDASEDVVKERYSFLARRHI